MTDAWFNIFFDSDSQAVFIECNAEQKDKADFITMKLRDRSDIRFVCDDYRDGNLWYSHECSYEEAKIIMKSMKWYASYYDRKIA